MRVNARRAPELLLASLAVIVVVITTTTTATAGSPARRLSAPAPTLRPIVVDASQPVSVTDTLPGPRRTVRMQTRTTGSWTTTGTRTTTSRGKVAFTFRPDVTTQVRLTAPATKSGRRSWPKVTTGAATVTVRGTDPGGDVRGEFTLEALTPLTIGRPATIRVNLPSSVPDGEIGIQQYVPQLELWGFIGSGSFTADDTHIDVHVPAGNFDTYGRMPVRAVVINERGTAGLTSDHQLLDVAMPNGGVGGIWGNQFLSSNGTVVTANLESGVIQPQDPFHLPGAGIYSRGTSDTRRVADLLAHGWLVDVSENSRYVLYSDGEPLHSPCGNSELFVLDRSTGTVTRASATPPEMGDRCPYAPGSSVADNGDVIFYSFTLDEQPSDPAGYMFLRHLDEPHAQPLTRYRTSQAVLAGDGTRLVIPNLDTNQNFHWYAVDPVTGTQVAALDDLRPATGDDMAVVTALSQDGSTALVAFRTLDGVSGDDVYLWDIDAGTLTAVIDNYTNASNAPVLSGDGASVAYQTGRTIWVWNRDTGHATSVPLTTTSYGYCQKFGLRDLSFDGTRLSILTTYGVSDDCSYLPNYYEALTVSVPH